MTERLLHAAAEVFAQQGYERAGVAEIARRAGVTTGAIYTRYRGKAELLLDAVDHHVPDQIERLLRADHAGESPTEVLASLGAHLLDDLPTGHGLFLEAIVAGRLAKLVDEAVADGLIDADLDRLATVRLAHAIGFGMTLTRAMGLDLPDTASWTTIIGRVLDAVAASAPTPSHPITESSTDHESGATP